MLQTANAMMYLQVPQRKALSVFIYVPLLCFISSLAHLLKCYYFAAPVSHAQLLGSPDPSSHNWNMICFLIMSFLGKLDLSGLWDDPLSGIASGKQRTIEDLNNSGIDWTAK